MLTYIDVLRSGEKQLKFSRLQQNIIIKKDTFQYKTGCVLFLYRFSLCHLGIYNLIDPIRSLQAIYRG